MRVNGSRALLIQPGDINYGPNLIGGHSGNSVSAGAVGATIGGGGANGQINSVTSNYGAVGGGKGNSASAWGAVSGGYGNTASGEYATVSGGAFNTASESNATVGGGYDHTASGFSATVPGGEGNTASGSYSFAAGRQAKAIHDGAFVWADNQASDWSSSAANTFKVRAQNGAWIQANNTNYASVIDNDGNGDGLRAYTASSQGNNFGAAFIRVSSQ